MDRKKFLNQIFRYGIIGGLGMLSGFLLLKRKITVESSCTNNFACKNCKKYNKCTLPEKG